MVPGGVTPSGIFKDTQGRFQLFLWSPKPAILHGKSERLHRRVFFCSCTQAEHQHSFVVCLTTNY